MLGFNVFAADSDDEAALLASSAQQSFVNLRTGQPGKLPPPVPGYLENASPEIQALIRNVLSCSAIGNADTVAQQISDFVQRTDADELMITSNIFDHAARLKSYDITRQVHERLSAA